MKGAVLQFEFCAYALNVYGNKLKISYSIS